jgi:pimeloyl-ACP methyl ester carboxylesterase
VTTFVLVHGAWGGAHGFRLVRPLLTRAGHDVFTPSLTGIGERAHLASPLVDLDVHVRDVVAQLFYEDLRDVVLLGYSYGGMVVTGVLEHAADRVRELVYLDAFVPQDGQSLYGLTGATPPSGVSPADWLVPPMPRQYSDAEAEAWALARRSAHPIGCFTQPVSLPVPLEDGAYGLTYVKAVGEPRPAAGHPFWTAGDHARESSRWRYFEVDTDHLIPQNRPQELADILLATAAGA